MKEMIWFFDCWVLGMIYGPFRQNDYHFFMFGKWGERYNRMYIKRIFYYENN
jgi:hypothetical protein